MRQNSFGFWHLMIAIPLFCAAVVTSALAQSQDPRPASQSELAWVTAAIPAQRVSFRTFDSAAAKTKVSYHIYTPAAYDQDAQRQFPVVYWLHGSGGGLTGIPRVAALFEAAIAAG
ncbi:MAG: hypothetical protein ACK5T6_11265, partial [Pirellula sp.]